MRVKIEYNTENTLLNRVLILEFDDSTPIEYVRCDVLDAILDDLGVAKYKWEVIE